MEQNKAIQILRAEMTDREKELNNLRHVCQNYAQRIKKLEDENRDLIQKLENNLRLVA